MDEHAQMLGQRRLGHRNSGSSSHWQTASGAAWRITSTIRSRVGSPRAAAHLLEFDSVHGRWDHDISADVDRLTVDGDTLSYSDRPTPGAVDWEQHDAEIVLECSGRFRTMELMQPYLDAGVKKVIVAAPSRTTAR